MRLFPLKLFPDESKIDFISKRWIAFIFSTVLTILTVVLLFTKGLNLGIDFTGGILIEAKFEQAADLGKMRDILKHDELGDISLQTFGNDNTILIRVGKSSDDAQERIVVVNKIKTSLAENFTGGIEYRKVDYVGPKVGDELIRSGFLALILSFAAMMVYIWFRFEWQYGLGGIIAIVHDAILTLGFFSFTGLEFNLSSIAAILTVVGYSINDSVVIFDRIREDIRKYKKLPITDLINLSVNSTLSRTILTSVTTLLSLIALIVFGGEVVKSFSIATFFGILIGTYSSVYIGTPVLIYMKLRRDA